jgi:exo-1,4-beta-D-glucosaminidase
MCLLFCRSGALTALFVAGLAAPAGADQGARLALKKNWSLQSSAKVAEKGEAISRPGYAAAGWHTVTVPNTVVGALVENGTYRDPYFGMNLRQIPGTTYPIGERFTLLPMPADSPFKASWWYRTEFELPADRAGRSIALHFDGINYRANVWLNGTRLATSTDVAGAFRRYEFDVTAHARTGARNAIAVEVLAPEPQDLAFMWVDWNPTPADKNMGLWGDVYLTDSGPIALTHPFVRSKVDIPLLQTAALTVSAELRNTTDRAVKGVLRGTIEGIRFSKPVSLAPRARATVRVTPEDVPALTIRNPRVWWPYRYGAQNLYTLSIGVDVDGKPSDDRQTRFGIHEMTSELTEKGHRLFKVNGKPVLIRGGGWASDMLLRPISTDRIHAELRYVREMGLNTIRLEGKLETDEFYDLADEYGILLMPGWCCCDQWELWKQWDAEDYRVAPASLRDQALRLRNHPSVLVWLNGSDFPPPADVERSYLDVLKEVDWSKPILSNATDAAGPVSGPSGVKMRGPYDYVPPSYWLTDTKNGGAFGFATEIGPGAAVPPIESLKKMVGPEHLWPMDQFWTYHAGGDEFKDLKLFTEALEARYGKATSVQDYARKSQALTYEGQRAMFEGFGRNKYTSTGVIQWMLNNAWPSMIWHLYDYYLRPGGGYFGTKKACEPLHVMYSYDDRSVVVVNELQEPFPGLKVTAQVFNLDLEPKFTRQARVDVGADAVARALSIPPLDGLSKTYFLRLSLEDAAGKTRSTNFYWLSTQEDVLDWANTKWYYTPTSRHADLTALAGLPKTTLETSAAFQTGEKEETGRVTVANTGKALAFQVQLKAIDSKSGDEILPVFWEDNYFELFPGEKREIAVSWPRRSDTTPPRVEAEAWNTARPDEGALAPPKPRSGEGGVATPPKDDAYRFAEGDQRSESLSASDGAVRLTWTGTGGDTALAGVRVSASGPAPWIEIAAGSGALRQYLDEGANGLRWLNLTGLRSQLTGGAVVTLRGHGVTIDPGKATIRTFANQLDLGKRILIIAPHPDDAEIAAFGLYAGRNATIVTVTAGNAGDATYKDNVADPAAQYQLKGYLRAVDSVTVPWQGGIPPERAYNLGYFDARLKTMRERPDAVVPEMYGPNQDVAPYRRANISRLLPNGSRTSTWGHLVEDLERILRDTKPEIVVMPHPMLDTHLDHQYAAVAVNDALERWNGKPAFLLYTNHASENRYPFGPSDSAVSVPPWSGREIPIESIYSYSLTPDLQRRKLFALESMHDLRLSPAEQAACGDPNAPRRPDYPRIADVDYLRRAPRPDEIFFVYSRDGVRRMIASFLNQTGSPSNDTR